MPFIILLSQICDFKVAWLALRFVVGTPLLYFIRVKPTIHKFRGVGVGTPDGDQYGHQVLTWPKQRDSIR